MSKNIFLKAVFMMIPLFLLGSGNVVFADDDIIPKNQEQFLIDFSTIGNKEEEPEADPMVYYPVEISESIQEGYKIITKTYALDETDNPAYIDVGSFKRQGVKFELVDVIKKENRNEDFIEHTELVEINTSSDKVEEILPLLEPEKYFELDGYAGTLNLDISSINCEVAGYKKNSFEVSKTREYPHLSSNDVSLVPKTIDEGGTTYKLADVDFVQQDKAYVDYETVPKSYTAVARYTAQGSSSTVTGYITTAQYQGTLSKIILDKTLYTVIFISAEPVIVQVPEIIEPEPEETETKEPFTMPPFLVQVFLTLLTIAAVAGVAFLLVFLMNYYNVTVYNQEGTKFEKVGRIRINYKKESPVIDISEMKMKKEPHSNVFIVELSEKATRDLTGSEVVVRWEGKEITHKIDENHGFKKYQIEINFDD